MTKIEAEFLAAYRERGGEVLREEERVAVEEELLADFRERHGEEAAEGLRRLLPERLEVLGLAAEGMALAWASSSSTLDSNVTSVLDSSTR